jgi:predicted Fe-Mo cluster-binding NifX family protein
MKVAVTAASSSITSQIDPRFGRAPWFVIVDTDSGQVEFHDNQPAQQKQEGAGIQAGQAVGKLGVQAVITGNVGPNAFRALKAAGMQVYLTYAGTVEGAIERLKAGRLTPADQPSRQGH